MIEKDYKKLFKDNLTNFSKEHDVRKVFEDFISCAAYAISNSCNYNDDLEQNYLNIVQKYTKEELSDFAQMLAYLQLECNKEKPIDILGNIYEEIGMSNKSKGQFFTPETVCNFMTRVNISVDSVKKTIEEKGYFSINDPACGSGRLLFSALDYLKQNDISKDKVYVTGDDISLLCCCMTYINLSLRGVSGCVRHQNTLTQEKWHALYTPAFVMNLELQDDMKKYNQENEAEI